MILFGILNELNPVYSFERDSFLQTLDAGIGTMVLLGAIGLLQKSIRFAEGLLILIAFGFFGFFAPLLLIGGLGFISPASLTFLQQILGEFQCGALSSGIAFGFGWALQK